jgi:broad specificity phosphatase PhoE
MCSHGDIIKSIAAEALGMHLDFFQRLAVDPCSVTVIRYASQRPFLLRLGDTGELAGLAPRERPAGQDEDDAVVGGGTGAR